MNLRKWFKRTRSSLDRHTVAVFGAGKKGGYPWGTGILIDFKGIPIVLTCYHVVNLFSGPIFITKGRFSYQRGPLHERVFSDARRDWACLVLRDRDLGPEKEFIRADEVLLESVDTNEVVLVYGFPVGHPKLQTGGEIDPAASTARFRSLTYLSLTEMPMQNPELRLTQPRIEWNMFGNVDFKSFQKLPRDLSPEERGGFSGGPVFLQKSLRLIGQVTHASPAMLWYNPIAELFRELDKVL